MKKKFLKFEFFLKSFVASYNSADIIVQNISRVNCPKLARMAIFKPP